MLHFKLRTNKTTATIHKENQIFYTCQKKKYWDDNRQEDWHTLERNIKH